MEIQKILELTDLRALAEQAGAHFNNSNRSRCPLHGGNNHTAFSVYTGQDGVWRWHCFTGCPDGANTGNAIDFYMRWRDVDFKTAITELARQCGVQDDKQQRRVTHQPVEASTIKPTTTPPGPAWIQRAAEFVQYSQRELWKAGKALFYLHAERGFTDDIIGEFGLGYNPRDLYDDASRWGMEGAKPIWLPAGIVIPHFRGNDIHFVNVRRPQKGDLLATILQVPGYDLPKYAGPRGGKRGLYPVGHLRGKLITLMVEGEFDAALVTLHADDMVDVATLGGAGAKLDDLDAWALARSCYLISARDTDTPGLIGNLAMGALGDRVIIEQPPAHDFTDYWRAGGSIRKWVADIVIKLAEKELDRIDEDKQTELFCRWMEVYQLALEV